MTQAVYGHASGAEVKPGADEIELVPVGYREDVLAIVAHDRSLNGPEELDGSGVTSRIIDQALLELSLYERLVVEARFGFNGGEETLEKIGAQLDISPQKASTIGRNGLEKLKDILTAAGLDPTADTDEPATEPGPRWTSEQISLQERWKRELSGDGRDETGTGISEWTPEQRELQEKWFEEIRAKQERGRIAFVKGSLLIEPLPPEIERFLARNVFDGRSGGTGLRLALQAAEEQRDPVLRRQAEKRRAEERVKETTTKANRAHSKVTRLEKKLEQTREEFEQAVGEGAEALSESGYPHPEPKPQE
jgi:hypothetical protein